jgi:hypothetical protein
VASLIKPGSVKIVTKEGEIQVSLTIDLNINVNSEGLPSGVRSLQLNEEVKVKSQESKEKFEWAIPDFEEAPKINFGKKEV